jgi:hypothetical protein
LGDVPSLEVGGLAEVTSALLEGADGEPGVDAELGVDESVPLPLSSATVVPGPGPCDGSSDAIVVPVAGTPPPPPPGPRLSTLLLGPLFETEGTV